MLGDLRLDAEPEVAMMSVLDAGVTCHQPECIIKQRALLMDNARLRARLHQAMLTLHANDLPIPPNHLLTPKAPVVQEGVAPLTPPPTHPSRSRVVCVVCVVCRVCRMCEFVRVRMSVFATVCVCALVCLCV